VNEDDSFFLAAQHILQSDRSKDVSNVNTQKQISSLHQVLKIDPLHLDTLCALACIHEHSDDNKKAAELYKTAAENGSAFAQYKLALSTEDVGESLSWLQKSAGNDHPMAACKLAYRYRVGDGVEKDLSVAFEWYKKAAQQVRVQKHCLIVPFSY
jgi:TPR repeat protein